MQGCGPRRIGPESRLGHGRHSHQLACLFLGLRHCPGSSATAPQQVEGGLAACTSAPQNDLSASKPMFLDLSRRASGRRRKLDLKLGASATWVRDCPVVAFRSPDGLARTAIRIDQERVLGSTDELSPAAAGRHRRSIGPIVPVERSHMRFSHLANSDNVVVERKNVNSG